MNAIPPRWAEAILRLCLAARDRQTVSGDLLEEYRLRIQSGSARAAAGRWYVRQVFGFAWRTHLIWAVLLSAAVTARTAIDWFVPTPDFTLRSTMSTLAGATIFLAAGVAASWRTRSVASGALAGAMTAVLAAAIGTATHVLLLAIWHDAGTLAAAAASGGLAEAFTLPLFLVVPGTAIGVVGGALGRTARGLTASTGARMWPMP